MAQYIDTWRVHVARASFAVSPRSVGFYGERIGVYNANSVGLSKRLYKPNGDLRENVVVKTIYRGNFGSMYPSTMR